MGWTAASPEDDDRVGPPRVVEGTDILMMPEYSIEIPLWDGGGPIGERQLLTEVLGLSSSLIDDLADWQAAWDDMNGAAASGDTIPDEPPPEGWDRHHRRRGQELFARLRHEIALGYEVRLQPF